MSISSDIERGNPEDDHLQPLLGPDPQPSTSRLEVYLEDQGVDPLPPSPTSQDKLFIWPQLYLNSNDDGTEPASPFTTDYSVEDQKSMITPEKWTSEEALINYYKTQSFHEPVRPKTENSEEDKAVRLINQNVLEKLIENGALLRCWNDKGETPLHVCVEQRLGDVLETLIKKVGPEVKNSRGKTVLRAAVDARWFEGVCIALKAGADVSVKAPDGETPLHSAATGELSELSMRELYKSSESEIKELHMLNRIINVAEQNNAVDCLNGIGETALFNTVRAGSFHLIGTFLAKRASITHTNENKVSVFHIAAEKGHDGMLCLLLGVDNDITKQMIDKLTDPSCGGLAPIHLAVLNDKKLCVEMLMYRNADICIKSTDSSMRTPLHMAVDVDSYEIAECILRGRTDDKKTSAPTYFALKNPQPLPLEQTDGKGWLPLHSAIHKGSEKFIKLFLRHNASLASQTQSDKPKTAMDMIMHHVTNPTEFLEDVLDSYISLDGSMNKVKIDYQLMMSDKGLKEEMEVVDSLIKTGNEFKQKRLLLHPLIESFIYLKWWALCPFYILIAVIYLIFVTLLATFTGIVFYNIDKTKVKPDRSDLIWGTCVILFFIIFNILQEILMNVEGIRYFLKPENFFKLGSLGLAIVLCPMIIVDGCEEAARHIASGALLMACFQMLNIISQSPSWGYYVVMFKKVICNVLKILGTFAVLILGFALCFMIQFRSNNSFDGMWNSTVKTLFLLTAEFDYNDVFNAENAEKLGSSFEGLRVVYVTFLILAAIVLMNMMVGVAVDDISELKKHGNIGRLQKQAAFVRSLDTLKYNLTRVILPEKYRRNLFPRYIHFEKKTVKRKIFSSIRKMPKRFQDAFFSIAQKNMDKATEQKKAAEVLEAEKTKYTKQYNHNVSTRYWLNEAVKKTRANASRIEDIDKKLELLREDCSEIKQLLLSLIKKKVEEPIASTSAGSRL